MQFLLHLISLASIHVECREELACGLVLVIEIILRIIEEVHLNGNRLLTEIRLKLQQRQAAFSTADPSHKGHSDNSSWRRVVCEYSAGWT